MKGTLRGSGLTLLCALIGCGRGDPRRADSPLAPRASASEQASVEGPSASASAAPDEGRVPMAEDAPLDPALPDDVDAEVRHDLPKSFAHDGSIAEWGDVCSAPPDPKRPVKRKRKAAPTCATIAVLADRVVIAGKLGEMGAKGMWLGLTMPLGVEFPSPQISVDGQMQSVSCEEGGAPNTKQICQRYQKLWSRAVESTGRFYAIGPKGVAFHDLADGLPAKQGKAVAGAKLIAGTGGAFEIEMPLSSLPRSGASPITEVFLSAGAGELPTIQRQWSSKKLTSGVELEPLGELRSTVIGQIASSGLGVVLYQPGSDEVEVFSAARTGAQRDVSGKKRKLFESKIKTDTIEAGVAPGLPTDLLTVRPKDGAIAVVPLDTWRLVDVALVGGEPRAFTMFTSCDGGSPCGATIVASRITVAGKLEQLGLEPPDDVDTNAVDSATPYLQNGGTVFGIRGTVSSSGSRKPYDLRWTWDPKKAVYVGVQTGGR